jgi:hypothetical protein
VVSIEVECPSGCGNTESVWIDDPEEDGTLEAECSQCDVQFDVTYSVAITVDEVQITRATAEDSCPECFDSISLEIASESGSEEIECDNDECGAHLELEWSDWGRQTEVLLLGKREDFAEEVYEEEAEEDEDTLEAEEDDVEYDDEEDQDEDEDDDSQDGLGYGYDDDDDDDDDW